MTFVGFVEKVQYKNKVPENKSIVERIRKLSNQNNFKKISFEKNSVVLSVCIIYNKLLEEMRFL
jgi:hypothetical protein